MLTKMVLGDASVARDTADIIASTLPVDIGLLKAEHANTTIALQTSTQPGMLMGLVWLPVTCCITCRSFCSQMPAGRYVRSHSGSDRAVVSLRAATPRFRMSTKWTRLHRWLWHHRFRLGWIGLWQCLLTHQSTWAQR